MNEETTEHEGGCLCGAIRYKVIGKPIIVAHCHCEDCQRSSGAGHTTGAMYPTDKFKLTGNIAEHTLTSETGSEVTKCFCPSCGSPIYGRNTRIEQYVTVTLGTLDNAKHFTPEVTIFSRNKNPWDIMDKKIQAFESQPNWEPNENDA